MAFRQLQQGVRIPLTSALDRLGDILQRSAQAAGQQVDQQDTQRTHDAVDHQLALQATACLGIDLVFGEYNLQQPFPLAAIAQSLHVGEYLHFAAVLQNRIRLKPVWQRLRQLRRLLIPFTGKKHPAALIDQGGPQTVRSVQAVGLEMHQESLQAVKQYRADHDPFGGGFGREAYRCKEAQFCCCVAAAADDKAARSGHGFLQERLFNHQGGQSTIGGGLQGAVRPIKGQMAEYR